MVHLFRAVFRVLRIYQSYSVQYYGCWEYSTVKSGSFLKCLGYIKIVPRSYRGVRDTAKLFRIVIWVSRIQHCCSGQFFFKIQYSCFGQYSGYSGHSTVVPSSILAFQNIVQLFRAVFWVFRIQHTCSGQFSGCSGYCTVVRGSYLVFRNTLKFIRAVFRVLSKQQGCFGLYSGW